MGTTCYHKKDSSTLGNSDNDFLPELTPIKEKNLTIYEKLGGKDAITAAVDLFYGKILEDPIVMEIFKNTNMNFQRMHQKNFLTYPTGGPNIYNGKSMREAHKNLNLTDTHFNLIKMHLANTLEELGVKEEWLVNKVAVLLELLRKEVLSR